MYKYQFNAQELSAREIRALEEKADLRLPLNLEGCTCEVVVGKDGECRQMKAINAQGKVHSKWKAVKVK